MPVGGQSGTFNFNPSLGELVLYSFGMCGIRRTQLTQEHMQDAHFSANFVLGDWINKGVNLWQVEHYTIPLVAGQATYTLDPAILVMLDAYVTTGLPWALIDRIIMPVGRTEYASFPNKAQQGFPTVFWMNRLLAPNVSLWPVPDGNQTSLTFYALKQNQDANYDSGQQVGIPYAWLNAFATALAAKIAVIWAPDRAQMLTMLAEKDYAAAAVANIETAITFIAPMTGGYYR